VAYWLEHTIRAQRAVGSNPKKVNGGDKKSDLNSILSSNKISLLTRQRTPRPRTGINNMEYKRKQTRLTDFLYTRNLVG